MAQVTNLTARRHASDITLCVDYVVNPTPAMMEIGTNFHKTLTPLVKDREVLHENTAMAQNCTGTAKRTKVCDVEVMRCIQL